MLRNALRLRRLTIPSLSAHLRQVTGRQRPAKLARRLLMLEGLALHRCLMLEIDGATYHQDRLEDARKTAIWRAAGWRVERVPAEVVYDDPPRLIRAARRGS